MPGIDTAEDFQEHEAWPLLTWYRCWQPFGRWNYSFLCHWQSLTGWTVRKRDHWTPVSVHPWAGVCGDHVPWVSSRAFSIPDQWRWRWLPSPFRSRQTDWSIDRYRAYNRTAGVKKVRSLLKEWVVSPVRVSPKAGERGNFSCFPGTPDWYVGCMLTSHGRMLCEASHSSDRIPNRWR